MAGIGRPRIHPYPSQEALRARLMEVGGILYWKRNGKPAGHWTGIRCVIIFCRRWYPHDELLAILRGEPLPPKPERKPVRQSPRT